MDGDKRDNEIAEINTAHLLNQLVEEKHNRRANARRGRGKEGLPAGK